ncbi:hypothetical protein BDR26DRAFT_893650 [Obelidium mucronatum]|nr:hypothetical protein BDR26DRAFT_893650 [Obelidium mucronatum]
MDVGDTAAATTTSGAHETDAAAHAAATSGWMEAEEGWYSRPALPSNTHTTHNTHSAPLTPPKAAASMRESTAPVLRATTSRAAGDQRSSVDGVRKAADMFLFCKRRNNKRIQMKVSRTQLLANLDSEAAAAAGRVRALAAEKTAALRHRAALLQPSADVRRLRVADFCARFGGSQTAVLGRRLAQAKAALPAQAHASLSRLLPKTPHAAKRLRRARPNESLISVNGSPVAPPDNASEVHNPDDSVAAADLSMFQTSFCMPSRRITLKSGLPRESFATSSSDMSFSGLGTSNAFMLNIPLDGGNTVLELDPAQSPTALGGLDADRKTEVKSQLQKMQDQLQSLLMQIN